MSLTGESHPTNVPPNQNYAPHHGRGRHGGPHSQRNYEMTEEERRVFRECQTESFWYRAMPLAVGAGLLTQTLILRGMLTTSTRFGSLPKVGFACLTGYMAGKISYVNTCKQKFLKLENSPIGEMLRKGGSMPTGQGGNFGLPGFQAGSIGESDPGSPAVTRGSDSYSSFGQPDDYRANLDIDTSNVKTMDSHFDFELTNEAASELEAKRPEMTKTYEDLRRENRQKHSSQYSQVLPGHYHPRQPTPPSHDDIALKKADERPFPSVSRPRVTKNKYGDDME
ncbi:OCIA domain-containing protein 1-like [Acanthaster planci]|uniref:OCIA domain-containing protein 1-like n=1 Tax=Acanthaster planci TaxID=133434 RepID=A0A8B7ZQ90_ACAPL|nr:OCIA domain-containing protein 1-like [Acanthaster planci]